MALKEKIVHLGENNEKLQKGYELIEKTFEIYKTKGERQ